MNRVRIFSVIYVFLIGLNANSQKNDFTIVMQELDEIHSIVNSYDHGFVLIGSSYVMKIDSIGNISWVNDYIGKPYLYDNSSTCITETSDSCFVFADRHEGNIVCIKIDIEGDTIWSNKIVSNDYTDAIAIEETIDNGFVLLGQTSHYDKIDVSKLDSYGNLEWMNSFRFNEYSTIGYSIKETPDSGFVVLTNTNTNGYEKTSLIKLDVTGNLLWGMKYTSPFAESNFGVDMEVSATGLVFIIYNHDKTHGNNVVNVMKTDFEGNIVWCNTLNEDVPSQSTINAPQSKLNPTSDGGVVVNILRMLPEIGDLIVKIDSTGSFEWGQVVKMYSREMIETNDNDYAIIGQGVRPPLASAGVGVIRTDSLGTSSTCVTPAQFSFSPTTYNQMLDTVIQASAGSQQSFQSKITPWFIYNETGCVRTIVDVKKINARQPLFSFYPNPSDGIFTFNTTATFPLFINIYNTNGQRVFESRIMNSGASIDLTNHPKGIYLLKIFDDYNNVSSHKIIME